jgi:hypothetical protein
MEGNTMTATIVHLPDGTEMSGSDVVCNNCDSSVAGHSCVAGSGSAPAVVYSRSGKGSTRKKADEKPPCAHCGAPMHFNYGATETNAKCMMTQYALDTGLISDPLHQKAPVLTAEMVVDQEPQVAAHLRVNAIGGGRGRDVCGAAPEDGAAHQDGTRSARRADPGHR